MNEHGLMKTQVDYFLSSMLCQASLCAWQKFFRRLGMSTVIVTQPHPSVYQNGYSITPNDLINNSELSTCARILLLHLLSCPPKKNNGENWTFHDSVMCKVVNCGQDKLKKLFRELRNAGYVRTTTIQNEKGIFLGKRRQFASTPIFKLQDALKTEKKSNKNKGHTEGMKNPPSVNTTVGKTDSRENQPSYNNTDLVNNTDLSKNTDRDQITCGDPPALVFETVSVDRLTRAETEEIFERFWERYPNKKGKQRAKEKFLSIFRALCKAEAENVAMSILDGFCAHLRESELYNKARDENPSWRVFYPSWPHGSTWITQKRWEDSYKSDYEEILNEVRKDNGGKSDRREDFAAIFSGRGL